MLFEKLLPDGRVLVVTWSEVYGTWCAKLEESTTIRRGERAGEAIAAATGCTIDDDWIAELARELETTLELDRRLIETTLELDRRLESARSDQPE
jgi:hypothetical protein